MTHSRIPSSAGMALMFLSATATVNSQTLLPVTPQISSAYVDPRSLHSEAREYLRAYGLRLTAPGQERTVLTGKYSVGKASVPVTITFQLPNQVRVDLGGPSSKTLIFDGKLSTAKAGSPDEDLLETLSDDTAESFFYGFSAGSAIQWLGSRFRNDDGKTTPYTGPLRDIYRRVTSVKAVSGAPVRAKLYLFDSRTKWFAGCHYELPRNGVATKVQIDHGTWTTMGAEAFPSVITRTEGGKAVFTISINSAVAAAKTADSTFIKP